MSHRTHKPQHAPYSVRTKKANGKVHTQIYVPSTVSEDGTQNYVWIQVVDPPVGDESLGLSADEALALLYDPTYVPEWKVAYLYAAYLAFRAAENARNHGDLSYSDWEVEIHDGPQYMNVSVHEDQFDRELMVSHYPQKTQNHGIRQLGTYRQKVGLIHYSTP